VNENNNFDETRRQPYLTYTAYQNTINHFEQDHAILAQKLIECGSDTLARTQVLGGIAFANFFTFQLRYTAGVDLHTLKTGLSKVIAGFKNYVDECNSLDDENYYSPFVLDDLVDTYVEYLNLICFCILLHREDLLPEVHGLISGTQYDGDDAVIEELFTFFLKSRPELDRWIWEKPYRLLLDAIDGEASEDRANGMKKYVEQWYGSMKDKAFFWGMHEKIKDSFSPYFGYWALCAGAFTYLLDIDDSSYRNEMVYPRDLVDYARSEK
jgi:hypothetical protein